MATVPLSTHAACSTVNEVPTRVYSQMKDKLADPWVVVSPQGVQFLGFAVDETTAWSYALGWPDAKEVERYKALGWYATPANVTWKKPTPTVDLFNPTPEVDLFK